VTGTGLTISTGRTIGAATTPRLRRGAHRQAPILGRGSVRLSGEVFFGLILVAGDMWIWKREDISACDPYLRKRARREEMYEC